MLSKLFWLVLAIYSLPGALAVEPPVRGQESALIATRADDPDVWDGVAAALRGAGNRKRVAEIHYWRGRSDPAALVLFDGDGPRLIGDHLWLHLRDGRWMIPQCPNGELPTLLGCVEAPGRISVTPPKYPEGARRRRITGSVVVRYVIRVDGSVDDATVLSCTYRGMGFESAALNAVRSWRYLPAKQDNEPVEIYATAVINFQLR